MSVLEFWAYLWCEVLEHQPVGGTLGTAPVWTSCSTHRCTAHWGGTTTVNSNISTSHNTWPCAYLVYSSTEWYVSNLNEM